MSGDAAQYFAQNFAAVLDMMAKLAGETIFDVLRHPSYTPKMDITLGYKNKKKIYIYIYI